jgi:3-dehydroquinate dehydratase type I
LEGRICIPIMAEDTAGALQRIQRAEPLADMIEIRLDGMKSFNLVDIIQAAHKPAMVTYRSKREGGKGSARPEMRTRFLLAAVEAGANFVDVEYGMPLEFRRRLFQARGRSRVVLSAHRTGGTPSRKDLEGLFQSMRATGADVVKIVTTARTPEDNLRVLSLIPRALNLNTKLIAFCMGPMGRLSRMVSPLLGGYLTFASLEKGEESAHGQIPAAEMRRMMEILKG